MKTVTVKQIQNLDKLAIGRYGVPSLALMENAGRGVALEALKVLKSRKRSCVVVVCGMGNNAGDGFVVARHLWNAGVDVQLFLIGSAGRLKGDAAVNYQILERAHYPVKTINKATPFFRKALQRCDLAVDAIFGVGVNREVLDPFKSVITAINAARKRVIAVDVPSGLDATTGRTYGACIKAHRTVTFSFAKKGFFKQDGPRHVGKVIVADIGIPQKIGNRV